MEKNTKHVPRPQGWPSQWANAEASARTKSLDSATINALFPDKDVLTHFFISTTFPSFPDAYRFEMFDPKVDRISALEKELLNSGGEVFVK